MGVYSEYLNNPALKDFNLLTAERKKQLARISQLRGGRDVLVFGADLANAKGAGALTQIAFPDIVPIADQLTFLNGQHLDLVLETPGGFGEVTEEIVGLIRQKYESFAVIVPGWAKSAGTILAMAADEILMGQTSALGPIDAQLSWQGKTFSADALLAGVKKIKDEVTETGILNKAYVPTLQNLSPGELQHAQNALDFATQLVTDWLAQYKFKDWITHSSTGQAVTPGEKQQRAKEIAKELCDHQKWRTHGRSLKIKDLEGMRLRITDYSKHASLSDAITRYYALLQMSFGTNIYKVYETVQSQIYRTLPEVTQPVAAPAGRAANPIGAGKALLNFQCTRCQTMTPIQANLGMSQPLEPGRHAFPNDNRFVCPKCGTGHDLAAVRHNLEAQTKQRVV